MTKKQWQCQRLAQHLHTTSLMIATEAARRGAMRQSEVMEHAILAEETRNFATSIFAALEQHMFGEMDDDAFDAMILDSTLRSKLLAINAAINAAKTDMLKPLAVFAEEIRNISSELRTLCAPEDSQNEKHGKPVDIPEAEPRSAVITNRMELFTAVSGRYVWSENIKFIIEVLRYCPEYIKDGHVQIINQMRHMDEPIPILWPDPSCKEVSALVIVCAHNDTRKKYAVAADMPDDWGVISYSRVGIAAKSTLPIPVRECWRGMNGNDIHFVDWEALSQTQK